MSNSPWEESDEWRSKTPTFKQQKMIFGLVKTMLSNMNRGEASDLIGKLTGKVPISSNTTKLSDEDYDELKEDLQKKNRSWKWKEDLK